MHFHSEIQPECDCMPIADVPVIPDKGILVSDELVAIEQASIDMLRNSEPLPESAASKEKLGANSDILLSLHKKNYSIQLDEAEKLELGSRTYELVEVPQKEK